MSFIDILDDAVYTGEVLCVLTRKRGKIIGRPYCVDEYDTDEERLGYCLQTGKNREDTVFLDEIVDIKVVPKADYTTSPLKKAI